MKTIALLLLLPTAVLAGSLTLNWTKPTQNTDGSTLTDGTGYKAYCAATSAGVPAATAIPIPGITTTTFTTPFPAGPVFCAMSTVSTSGGEGAKSNIASSTVPASVPNPPSNVTMTTSSGIAYYLIQQPGKLVMLPTGTLSPNTVCDAKNAAIADGMIYYAVPTTSVVTWYGGKPKPGIAVMAQCG
jgi:hypothetical protein